RCTTRRPRCRFGGSQRRPLIGHFSGELYPIRFLRGGDDRRAELTRNFPDSRSTSILKSPESPYEEKKAAAEELMPFLHPKEQLQAVLDRAPRLTRGAGVNRRHEAGGWMSSVRLRCYFHRPDEPIATRAYDPGCVKTLKGRLLNWPVRLIV